jgi:hypothetical protein
MDVFVFIVFLSLLAPSANPTQQNISSNFFPHWCKLLQNGSVVIAG